MPEPHPAVRPPRRLFGRGRPSDLPRSADVQHAVDALVPDGSRRERVLATAGATTPDGPSWVAGTATAGYLPMVVGRERRDDVVMTVRRRVPWTQVERAHWDADASTFTVVETDGVTTRLTMDDAARFGQLVKERVEASVLVDRHVRIEGRRGVRIVARRDPSSDAAPTWRVVSDRGLDLSDPAIEAAVAAEVAAVRDEVGD